MNVSEMNDFHNDIWDVIEKYKSKLLPGEVIGMLIHIGLFISIEHSHSEAEAKKKIIDSIKNSPMRKEK